MVWKAVAALTLAAGITAGCNNASSSPIPTPTSTPFTSLVTKTTEADITNIETVNIEGTFMKSVREKPVTTWPVEVIDVHTIGDWKNLRLVNTGIEHHMQKGDRIEISYDPLYQKNISCERYIHDFTRADKDRSKPLYKHCRIQADGILWNAKILRRNGNRY